MIIRDIIAEAEETQKDKSWAQSAKEFGSEWASDVAKVPGELAGFATDVGKAAIDPETYKKAGEKAGEFYDYAKKDPRGAVRKSGETISDFLTRTGNRATFGLMDKATAAANALTGYDTSSMDPKDWKKIKEPTDYETEKSKMYDLAAAAQERSPTATKVGDVTGTLVSPPFLTGAKLARSLGGAVLPKTLQKVFTPVAGQTTKNVAKGTVAVPTKLATDIAGGIAAEKGASNIVKKVDPYDPYHGEEKYRAFEDKTNTDLVRLKDLINYRL